MELTTIEMEKDQAKEAFEQYRAAVKERHDAEDEQIMRAYKALAKGQQLIRLSEVVAAGGLTSLYGRGNASKRRYDVPRLAVARAHAEFAWTAGIRQDGSVRMQSKEDPHPNNTFDRVGFGAGTFPDDEGRSTFSSWTFSSWRPSLRAMAPKIPPPFRPAHKLSGYHLLWEAEWSIQPPPPGDPALLKHVGGDLYAVLAVWDLTEVEQAVLAGRTSE